MRLDISDVSELLAVPEATVERWIQQGKIPAIQDRNKYFFVKKDLRKWAKNHNIFLHDGSPEKKPKNLQSEYTLLEAMKKGGVFFNVPGNSVPDVLKNIVSKSQIPFDVDKTLLYDMLLQREKLASTAIGSGVAIPHPRYPIKNFVGNTIITTCFTEKEIDFQAIDGAPVFVVFLMLSPSTDMHLKFLSRLSYFLRNDSFISLLKQCSNPECLFNEVEKIEESINE
jgi:PTS system nitrogen regulatory IIA component